MQINPELLTFIYFHRDDDTSRLLLKGAPQGIDLREAVEQIELRRRLTDKLRLLVGSDKFWIPSRLAAEQCSSEATADYKAALIGSVGRGCDLTGGLGVDSISFAARSEQWHYVERNAHYCEVARHNFDHLSVEVAKIATHNDEALAFLSRQSEMDFVYLDPARRGEGNKRLFALTDYEPNFFELLPQIERLGARFMIKVSPMADLTHLLREVPHVETLDVVSVRNECKEILISGRVGAGADDPIIRCANYTSLGEWNTFAFTFEEERRALPTFTSTLSSYLYEPDSSIRKAGAFNTIALRFGLCKLHPNSHLYTSSEFIPDSFNGRVFAVQEVIPFTSANLKRVLPRLKKANITCRNFPLTVSEFRKRTKIAEGGDLYLFATTLADGEMAVVVSEKVPRLF